MSTETIKFRLGKNPLVKEKVIVLEETDGRKAIIFPMYRQKHEIEHAEVAKEGEVLELTGKWGQDKKTGEPRFWVDKAFNAKVQEEVNMRPPVVIPGDISPIRQAEDKSPRKIILAKKATLRDNMKNNFYPGPLFDGDPYAIDPEVDFTESDLIKICKTKGGNAFYTDSRLWWVKDHETMRNKMIMPEALRELYLAQHNISAMFSTSILWDEEEIEKEPLPQGCPAEF